MAHPGILLISTRKYKQFVQSLVTQIDEFFLPEHQKTIFIFTDEFQQGLVSKSHIQQIIIPSYQWPYPTLYRFMLFDDNRERLMECTHLHYLDVDMSIENIVSTEILGDGLTVVYHPGFYSKKEVVGHWGSNGVVRESLAWIDPEKRVGYVAGGFNGGQSEIFLEMARVLSENIKDDESRGVIAEHNDESHLNAYLKNIYTGPITYLTPSHCMVQQQHLRAAWGISELKPIIIALGKNHDEIRS